MPSGKVCTTLSNVSMLTELLGMSASIFPSVFNFIRTGTVSTIPMTTNATATNVDAQRVVLWAMVYVFGGAASSEMTGVGATGVGAVALFSRREQQGSPNPNLLKKVGKLKSKAGVKTKLIVMAKNMDIVTPNPQDDMIANG